MARLLLIEQDDVLRSALQDAATTDDRWICERFEWGTFSFESLEQRSDDLIVATVVHNLHKSIAFFRWLREHPIKSPTIAVFASDLSGELYRACCKVVDDFVFWPIRYEELQQRIARLLPGKKVEVDATPLRDKLSGELGFGKSDRSAARIPRTDRQTPTCRWMRLRSLDHRRNRNRQRVVCARNTSFKSTAEPPADLRRLRRIP